MKLLALERELSTLSADDQPHLKAEAGRVWTLVQQGVVREIYFRADQHTAVLILECEDAAAARAVLDTLPLVQAGLIDFDIIPLAPYDGFARLFASHPT
ncbi:MAG: superoxide dismutase [Chloroflexi bacterium]|nr:superoxide dismutase [Chloroflexota bacterium]